MRTLAVASAGGHLSQLVALADRFDPPSTSLTWVTYPYRQRIPEVERDLQIGAGPSTRSLRCLVRNTRLATRLVDPNRFDRVVSTGAAIGVPFLGVARLRGIAAHYVESATRTAAPSLTGRIAARIGVHTYTQHGEWATPRWRYAGSVFDVYRSCDAGARGPDPHIPAVVLVALGTHDGYPFPRLPLRCARVAPPGSRILWQLGSTPLPAGLGGEVLPALPQAELIALMGEVDAVVGHAGTGTALAAMAAGKVPVLVPRRRAFAEAVDDHQALLGAALARRGLALSREVDDLSWDDVVTAASRTVRRIPAPVFSLR
jgi:UDP-N-acetylglucosamine--N-acetylmuramyl-(pentapeptide) pyrophosphoryl-undecaprenol N-acetylglucosamine transferase